MTHDPSSAVQRDPDGRLRHLITLEGLSAAEMVGLLNLAQFYLREAGDIPARDQILWGRTVANLFFEPSTRTRVSFELAALRLGADVVNLDMQSSSRVKGETVLDTIYTLQAMHADILVMRDAEPGLPAYVAKFVAPHISILNAGEALRARELARARHQVVRCSDAQLGHSQRRERLPRRPRNA